jgi:hypothetical protein
VIEKAAVETELNRCRVLAAKIANELRTKKPEHFVDRWSLADISTLKDSQARGPYRHR